MKRSQQRTHKSTPSGEPAQSRPATEVGEEEETAVDPVRIPPLFGLAPERWLPIAYAAGLVLILFGLLVLPGLLRHGSVVRVRVEPAASFVLLHSSDAEDVPAGPLVAELDLPEEFTSSGSLRAIGSGAAEGVAESFVPAGDYTMLIMRPGFELHQESVRVPGRAFFSLFFPSTLSLTRHLEEGDAEEVQREAAISMGSWTGISTPTERYQVPPIYEWAASDLLAISGFEPLLPDTADPQSPAALSETALASIANDVMARDFLRGTVMLSAGSASASLFGLQAAYLELRRLTSETRSGYAADFSTFARELRLPYIPMLQEGVESMRNRAAAVTPGSAQVLRGQAPIQLGGLSFLPFLYVDNQGDATEIWVSRTEVPVSLFRTFLDAQPQWAERDRIITQGHADEFYLSSLESDSPDDPMRHISHFAADAFAAWFSDEHADTEGLVARLPREREWRAVAALDAPVDGPDTAWRYAEPAREGPYAVGSVEGPSGLYDVMGNVWEMTSTWYRPGAQALGRPELSDAGESLPGAEIIVRGGAWTSPRAGLESAGLQPAGLTSPVVGMRLVME